MQPIFHIALTEDWNAALRGGAGLYEVSTRGVTLAQQGFIHCSTASQVHRIADAHYASAPSATLLALDPSLVRAEIRFENLDGDDELSPHIYGPLPVDAVVGIAPYASEEGGFPKVDDAFLGSNFGPVYPGPTATLVEVAATLIRDETGRILTVRKRGTARFMFPGGKPEPSETFEQTAIREAREEVGVVLAPEDIRFAGIFAAPAANEPELICREYLYEVIAPVSAPKIAAEIEQSRWLDPTQPLPDDTAPLVRLIVHGG